MALQLVVVAGTVWGGVDTVPTPCLCLVYISHVRELDARPHDLLLQCTPSPVISFIRGDIVTREGRPTDLAPKLPLPPRRTYRCTIVAIFRFTS